MKKKILALLCAVSIVGAVPASNGLITYASNDSVPVEKTVETTVEETTAEETTVEETNGETEKETETTVENADTNTEKAGEDVTEDSKKEEIYKAAYDKTINADSFKMEGKFETKVGEDKIEMTSTGVIEPKNKQSYVKLVSGDITTETYIKDGKVYTLEPNILIWQYQALEIETNPAEKQLINKEVLPLMNMKKLKDGSYELTSIEPIKMEQLKAALPPVSDLVTPEMPDTTSNIKIVIDKEGFISLTELDMDLQNKESSNTMELKQKLSYKFFDFNKAEPIKFPEELENAREMRAPNPGGPEITNSSVPAN